MLIRSSFLSTFKACKAKAFYKYELGLKPLRTTHVKNDLDFGSLVHDTIEQYHLNGDDAGKAMAFLESREIKETRRKNKATAKTLVQRYIAQCEVKMLRVEKLFSYVIPGPNEHVWLGRFDGIGEWAGERWVIEHKTTKPEYLIHKPNDQFIAYYIGANRLYGGVKGVLLNNLNCDKLEVTTTPITFAQDEVDEWIDEINAVADVYEMYKKLGIFPRNSNACKMYNSLCSYFPLCTEPEGSRHLIQERCYTLDEQSKSLSW